MSRAVIWVHHDALSRDHPVFDRAPDDARAVFVWDPDDIARRDWSLKRCVFVLECLADMGVEIVRGGAAEVLESLGVEEIYIAETPDPAFVSVIAGLDANVVMVPNRPFVSLSDDADMGRFFRYWNKIGKAALRPTPISTPTSENGSARIDG